MPVTSENIELTNVEEIIGYVDKNIHLLDFSNQRSLKSMLREKHTIKTIELVRCADNIKLSMIKNDGWRHEAKIFLTGDHYLEYRREQIAAEIEAMMEEIDSDDLKPALTAIQVLLGRDNARQTLRIIERDGYPQMVEFRLYTGSAVTSILWKPKE